MPRGIKIAESTCWTVIRMLACHKSPQEIQAFTDVSPRQQRRIFKRWRETSDVNSDPGGAPRKLTSRDVSTQTSQFIQGSVDATCDAYLDELQESLEAICGAEISQATIWRTLRRKGYRMKKVDLLLSYPVWHLKNLQITRKAIERSVEKRAAFTVRMGLRYVSNQLVCVDESSADRRTTYRGYAWAFGGSRAVRKAFFVRGRR
ncbi:hypothetical protein C8R47DRAFT_1076912 [Mycena vitilis]|nr:hypothetical protein C8R47DRAFT_1076912 [Mycena vitilis]